MTHNKGKRYIQCPECKRKRYCSHKWLPDDYREWICSKGHVWTVEIQTLERINKMIADKLIPKIKQLWDNDSVFYQALKRKS